MVVTQGQARGEEVRVGRGAVGGFEAGSLSPVCWGGVGVARGVRHRAVGRCAQCPVQWCQLRPAGQ